MRMLRWMCDVTTKNKIINEHVRGTVKEAPLTTKKITEKRLTRYENVKRRSALAKKNGRFTSTRKETERKTENQVERLTSVKEIWKVCG